MPDILGDLYEGILAFALEQVGEWKPGLEQDRPLTHCRDYCPYTEECVSLGVDPSIDVDPDVLAVNPNDTSLIAYVTHWRTTGFEKKFWRTAEEILEHTTHRPKSIGLNFVAEPISQSENLRRALGLLAGNLVDLPADWTQELDDSVSYFEDSLFAKLKPTSSNKVLDYCRRNFGVDENLSVYLNNLIDKLKSLRQPQEPKIERARLYLGCIRSRRHSPKWKIRDINVRLRTTVQLAALLLYISSKDNIDIDLEDFIKGSIPLQKESNYSTLSESIQTPYRLRGADAQYFASEGSSILGPRLVLEPHAFPPECRNANTLRLASLYLRFLKGHPIWREYLDRLCGGFQWKSVIESDDLEDIVRDVVVDQREGWRLDLLLSAASQSRVSFGAKLDKAFRGKFGYSVRKIAPFGDEAKNVLAYCVHGESYRLKDAPDTPKGSILERLCGLMTIEFGKLLRFPVNVSDALNKMKVKDMRTFLSGAPHPINGMLEILLQDLGLKFKKNERAPTIVTDWFGGNTGRTIYQYSIQLKNSEIWIKVSTGQDGNEGHKWKELAARMRAHRLFDPNLGSCWLILDGTWTSNSLRKLYESGYNEIFSVNELDDLEAKIKCKL